MLLHSPLVHNLLRPAIWIGCSQRAILGDRHLCGVTIDGRRAAKDNGANVCSVHGFDQRKRPCDVILVVPNRVICRLTDGL